MADQNQVTISAETYSAMVNESWNKYVLENRELLDKVSHLLKGEIQEVKVNQIDGEYVETMEWIKPMIDIDGNKQFRRPPINEEGYYFTMLHLNQALDKSQASGNLTQEQAMQSLEQVMKALTNVFATRWVEFGLGTYSETKAVLVSIMNLVKVHISKSIEMSLIKQLASQYNINEQRITGAENLPQTPQMTM